MSMLKSSIITIGQYIGIRFKSFWSWFMNVENCCWTIEGCYYCGLGFDPISITKLVFRRYFYREWYPLHHFSLSSICMDPKCGQVVHERWWVVVALKKPNLKLGPTILPKQAKSSARKIQGCKDFHLKVCTLSSRCLLFWWGIGQNLHVGFQYNIWITNEMLTIFALSTDTCMHACWNNLLVGIMCW